MSPPDGFVEAAGGLDEELVARLVAEAVVDRLETVEVDEEHGGTGVAGATAA